MRNPKDQSLTVPTADGGGKAGGGGIESYTEDSAAEFIRIEKNLPGLGFFTPTSRELKATRVKTVRLVRRGDDGQRVETSVRIVTGGDYGLPGTADLDKWLALHKLITNIVKRDGFVENPITFTSWELLALLGVHQRSGRNYEVVGEWLDRMVATTIETTGEGIIDGQRRIGKDRIKVFKRAVSFGRELEPGGEVADRNYVWLEDWQLESINSNYVIPVDFDAYRQLKNAIAKTLVPLLQTWLYATRTEGVFTKQYAELCQLLGIKQYAHESKIREKLGPSLAELETAGYLVGWGVERSRSTEGYKIVLRHGPKFYQDLELNRQRQGQLAAGAEARAEDAALVEALVERGVFKHVAEQLVSNRAPGQDIEGQIEWTDSLIAKKGKGNWDNPPGLFVRLIRANAPIDPNFETTRMRLQREQREQAASAARSDAYTLRCRYDEYVRGEITAYIKGLPTQRHDALIEEMRVQFTKTFPDADRIFREEHKMDVMLGMLERHVTPEVSVMSFDEFARQQGEG